MDSDKTDIEHLLDRIKITDRALRESERVQITLREKLLSSFGEVLWGIAACPDYKWSRYRDRTVVDLLTALGIEVEGRTTEKAVRPLPDYLNPVLEELRRFDRDKDREEIRQEIWAPE